ncbi:PAS domain-containing protein [Neobacillus cucumis]|uniref:PAS domain-containing protein n=1 Tax=Neobacillus cucumis TaxID=1740721 RepID=UPI0023BAEA8B|nr:PAS domain-containing protein [Neobacillus cucumis]
MCFTNALYFWGIFSSELFVLAPIARERIFESMQDGVLVIDISNRLIDYNQAAEQINPTLTPVAIGKEINLILNEYQGMQDQEFESE